MRPLHAWEYQMSPTSPGDEWEECDRIISSDGSKTYIYWRRLTRRVR